MGDDEVQPASSFPGFTRRYVGISKWMQFAVNNAGEKYVVYARVYMNT